MRSTPVRSPSACFWFATWFGTGLSPKAPGTVGTLATVPLHFVLVLLPPELHLAALAVIIGLGIWCADAVARANGVKDPQFVVVDESAGVLLALFLVRDAGWLALIAAVLGFRLFDIWKPWPIHALESLRPAGLGIMADDIAAGLVAGLLVLAGTIIL